MSFRSILLAAAAAVFAATVTQVQPAAAAHSESGAVFTFAQKQLSKPYHLGAVGLKRYDCSGLVYRTYFEAGLLKKISGKHLRARGYYHWFKDHGLVTKNPRPGDLVVWATAPQAGHPHRDLHRLEQEGPADGYQCAGQSVRGVSASRPRNRHPS